MHPPCVVPGAQLIIGRVIAGVTEPAVIGELLASEVHHPLPLCTVIGDAPLKD